MLARAHHNRLLGVTTCAGCACSWVCLHADAIVVTGTSAFSLSLQALGGLLFHTVYEHRPMPEVADPAGCLPTEFNKYKTNALIRNNFRRASKLHSQPASCMPTFKCYWMKRCWLLSLNCVKCLYLVRQASAKHCAGSRHMRSWAPLYNTILPTSASSYSLPASVTRAASTRIPHGSSRQRSRTAAMLVRGFACRLRSSDCIVCTLQTRLRLSKPMHVVVSAYNHHIASDIRTATCGLA